MKFDPTKPVQTRDGRKARIICTDRKGSDPQYSIIALVVPAFGDHEQAIAYMADGRFNTVLPEHSSDLINTPARIKREVWINVYGSSPMDWCLHPSKECADNDSSRGRLACVKVTIDCEDGEGL